jgi:hypothetical protein
MPAKPSARMFANAVIQKRLICGRVVGLVRNANVPAIDRRDNKENKMFEQKGIKAVHAIITDTCRSNRGDINAGKEAISRLAHEYDSLTNWHELGKGVKFHLILAVEMPETTENTNAN